MVLEYLVSPNRARRHPYLLLLMSALFVSFGVLVQLALPSVAGSIVIFAMVPAIPVVWMLLWKEEKHEEENISEQYRLWYTLFPKGESTPPQYNFFEYHKPLLQVFSFFFLGAIIAYAFWYSVLPPDLSQQVFSQQLTELRSIQKTVSGALLFPTASLLNEQRFFDLLSHNLRVLFVMFVFSFLYGIGALYLLLWNASLIGVVIGQKVKAVGILGGVTGFASLVPHGVFEIVAYFIATIAGGILSMSLLRFNKNKQEFSLVLMDVLLLTASSILLLVIAAFIESF